MILSINAPVMKKLLLLSYLFLYLTLGCEKKEVPPTNVASLTNEHFVEIIKINFNEELGGLRRMDKFCLEYFRNSQLPLGCCRAAGPCASAQIDLIWAKTTCIPSP